MVTDPTSKDIITPSAGSATGSESVLESLERTRGSVDYLAVLKLIHDTLKPRNYLEIGIRHGKSLSLASCEAVGVDPNPDIQVNLPESTSVVEKTSDDYFGFASSALFMHEPDLVFIDGMHLFEYCLRDFINVETHSGPNTVVVIDDISPNLREQASRMRHTRVWTGDVWKLYVCLEELRPDLCMIPLDSSPTGLLLITGLAADNDALSQRYHSIVQDYRDLSDIPFDRIINREHSICPLSREFFDCLDAIRTVKISGQNLAEHGETIRIAAYPV